MEALVSEEAAKLQRQYGGGDLSSFPQFSFSGERRRRGGRRTGHTQED